MLKRPTGNEEFTKKMAASGMTIADYITFLRDSPELHRRVIAYVNEQGMPGARYPFSGYKYRVPPIFSKSSIGVKKILLVGSCLLAEFQGPLKKLAPACICDIYLNARELPASPTSPIEEYQFQVVQIALRAVLRDMAFAKLRHDDTEGYHALFEHCRTALDQQTTSAMRWNREFGLLTFVVSLPVPQQNLVGRLLPRYDLRNPVYFVEKLNEHLAGMISSQTNAYFFDINEITATFGRRLSSEDNIAAFNHGGFISDFNEMHDRSRLEAPEKASHAYQTDVPMIVTAMWHEIFALYRSIRQTDAIKMVVIDLDDTLWRGVTADADPDNFSTQEGWPVAFWETLLILKKRGIILAIISKNTEDVVKNAWSGIVGKALALQDFAAVQINWLPKSENMRRILATVNLLPQNVVYIDDNPMQRAEIQDAYPEIRVLGGQPYMWRHYLLTAPELQPPMISTESVMRTEMIQGQVQRELAREILSSADFLASLHTKMVMFEICDVAHPRFGRALELINKTNQFNTTGQRWRLEDAVAAFQRGARFNAFELADKFTEYGLVGVLILDDTGIQQFVMSCRVMGLDAEIAAVCHIANWFKSNGHHNLFAAMVHTERNLPCRDVYSRCGFLEAEGGWQLDLHADISAPAHIAYSVAVTEDVRV